jgi:tetratricopeptide (TPR) repeat protein
MKSRSTKKRGSRFGSAALLSLCALLYAQHPAAAQDAVDSQLSGSSLESIADLSRRGKHFEALAKYCTAENQASFADKLAAAKSAWALGLVQRARALWDEVLANADFQGEERTRTSLARAIVELQESDFEEARAIAERAAAKLSSSDLRAQFWLVIAEALKEQNAMSLAEGYYTKALNDGGKAVQNEARYLLGECQLKLGMINDARYSFAGVEAGSHYTVQALRKLIEIDLSQRNYDGVLTWAEEGRESYPTDFRDGWLSYAMISSLVELGRADDAQKELHELKVRLSENSPWYTLSSAAVEAKLVGEMYPEAKLDR